MILCPSCQHLEVEGALFCSDCGAQLLSTQNLVTQTMTIRGETLDAFEGVVEKKNNEHSSGAITLQILDGGQMLPLADRDEFTMGRVSEGQPIMPDIDLTAYNAYEHGVSRLHAALKKKNQQIVILDLGSANGTYLNGQRLTPEKEYPLQHGNIISLGKLKLQFLLKNSR